MLRGGSFLALSACGGTSAPTTPVNSPPSGGGPGGVPAFSPTGPVTTAGELAVAGKTVYANRCAGCHGAQGEGGVTAPALIGTGANFGKYNSGGVLSKKISTPPPMNSPGSLSAQDYLSVTSYLLVNMPHVASNIHSDK